MSVIQTISGVFAKVFGTRNDRLIKAYRRRVEQINALEPDIRKLTDPEMRDRVSELRKQIADGTSPSQVLPEAFALMREATDRHVGIRNIFNLEHKFDPARLPANARAMFDKVRSEIQQMQARKVLGGEDNLVEPWLEVDIPNELYDAVRELYPESRPPFRARPFDVQLVGGIVLYEGTIAEMKTGEGKTIVAPLACFMAAVEGKQSHVVTVNDYLVQRDRDWVFPAFHKLGMTVGAIHPMHMQSQQHKAEAYQCDVVYGTNAEFGFDYLRDNMKLSAREQVQKRRDFCIVDEVDSILIDEARTPLIISGPARDDAPQYVQANNVAEQLVALQRRANQETGQKIRQDGFVAEQARRWRTGEQAIGKIVSKFRDLGPDFLDEKEAEQIEHTQYYVVKREQRQSSMTALGVEEAQKIVGTRFYVVGNDMGWDHLITNALRAHTCYEIDREYVVENGEVIIIDEFTGRKMVGRQWSDGLHQAVEAKEARRGVKIKQETQTLATITIQNFFKLYGRLSGMTGTAITEATEFMEIYKMDVICVPTNRPVIRADNNDLIFLTEKAKWGAIIDEIRRESETGRPVLVGTTSVEKSEVLSNMLSKRHGIEHEVLNAKQHEREAHIVTKAGHQHEDNRGRTVGNVTIATNMAGRGTDIKLTDTTRELGGLAIIGTERHEARRIDNQLRGRSGRQGDPGSSRFFISMEDDLMKMFAGGKTMKALSMLGMKEDDAIEHRWITKSVERAQRKVEERNFEIRKNLLEYDEVMEYQRNTFYGVRQRALEGREIKELIFEYISESIDDAVDKYLDRDFVPTQLAAAVADVLSTNMDPTRLRGDSLAELMPRIRSDAQAEARSEVENTLGEYLDPDMDQEDWDIRGLMSWAKNRFNVELKPRQIKESEPSELAAELVEAAQEMINRKPLDSLERFLEPLYAETQLAEWVQQKFGFDIEPSEFAQDKSERPEQRQQRVGELLYERADAAYARREVEYPVQFVLDMAFGAAQQGADASAWAADQLIKWAKARYELDLTVEQISSQTADQLYEMLVEHADQWSNGKLDAWVTETANQASGDSTKLAQAFAQRWGVEPNADDIEQAENVEEYLQDRARAILRTELTQLERYVLLQILDQKWKDHLYAMDQLKDTIGLRGMGEKDPKIEYKREGAAQFQEMLVSVRDNVTDLIYRARLTANFSMRNAYENQEASHQTRENTGVSASDLASAGTSEQQADLAAADRAGGGGRAVTQTIVRNQPKVGRNDPCPCGSGKKYKKCCGKAGG